VIECHFFLYERSWHGWSNYLKTCYFNHNLLSFFEKSISFKSLCIAPSCSPSSTIMWTFPSIKWNPVMISRVKLCFCCLRKRKENMKQIDYGRIM